MARVTVELNFYLVYIRIKLYYFIYYFGQHSARVQYYDLWFLRISTKPLWVV